MHKIEKLAIIISHPIQYYAPVFQLLAKQLALKVFYTWGEQSMTKYDQGFRQQIEWNIPLLDGYNYQFLENISKDPGTHHFNGIINPGLLGAVLDFQPEAILIYGWAWKSHLKALRFFKGKIPVYFRGDSTLLDQQKSFKSVLRKYFLKWIYSHIDKAFYVGHANKNYYDRFGLKEKQLVFAPHAIDNDRFSKDSATKSNWLRTQLDIKDDEILVLFAGKLESKKNPELLLDASIKLELKDIHLLFVGNGVLEESLKLKVEGLASRGKGLGEKKIDEKSFDYAQDDKLEGTQDDKKGNALANDIKKRIHFMDFQNQTEMPVVYQACDLFCLPSKGPGETWGLAVNEAMAAGKAVLVSTKVGCAADLVKPGINGEVFKSNDLNDIIQKLGELTGSKEKLTKMGIQSQQIIQNWSFEKQVEAIVDTIYNNDAK